MMQIRSSHSQQSPQQGFTLVELMVTLSVVAIIAVMAAPSFNTFFDKRRVIDAAEDLYLNMQKARSEAITRNTDIYMRFHQSAGGWQYAISQELDCNLTITDPTNAAACILIIDDGDGNPTENEDRVLHRYTNNDYTDVSMALAFVPSNLTFDPVRGTTNTTGTTTITLTSAGGKQLRIKVGILGQLRLCSPSGSGHIDGYSSNGC